MIDDDPIAPMHVEHRCEEIFRAGQLEQRYNYLLYTFAVEDVRIVARAYLDTIDSVAMFPERLAGDGESLGAPTSAPGFRRDVLSYLRRRFGDIKVLGPDGYADP